MPKFIAELQTACNVWEVHLAIRYDASEPTRPNQPYLATGRCGPNNSLSIASRRDLVVD